MCWSWSFSEGWCRFLFGRCWTFPPPLKEVKPGPSPFFIFQFLMGGPPSGAEGGVPVSASVPAAASEGGCGGSKTMEVRGPGHLS